MPRTDRPLSRDDGPDMDGIKTAEEPNMDHGVDDVRDAPDKQSAAGEDSGVSNNPKSNKRRTPSEDPRNQRATVVDPEEEASPPRRTTRAELESLEGKICDLQTELKATNMALVKCRRMLTKALGGRFNIEDVAETFLEVHDSITTEDRS